jgi:hypothetical protein
MSIPLKPGGTTHATLGESQLSSDPAARRLRERYITARFLQFPQPANALRDTSNVLRWARELLDDDQPRQSAELLQMALEEEPSQKLVWLFLIELAYVANDHGRFVELSDSFRLRFPQATELPVVDGLGRKLLPNDPRFAHGEPAAVSPGWSTPDSELRDALRQQRLHTALTDAMAFHLSRTGP